jgi:hypothetical protein
MPALDGGDGRSVHREVDNPNHDYKCEHGDPEDQRAPTLLRRQTFDDGTGLQSPGTSRRATATRLAANISSWFRTNACATRTKCAAVVETALVLRDLLRANGLKPWPKVTGGKGLHVMAPLTESMSHDGARYYTRQVVQKLVDKLDSEPMGSLLCPEGRGIDDRCCLARISPKPLQLLVCYPRCRMSVTLSLEANLRCCVFVPP